MKRVLFIPHALKDHAGYAAKARTAFGEIGLGLDALHEAGDARRAVLEAEAVFCGGGNTFRLLDEICRLDVAHLLRERVDQGMPYTGASAGSNLACPTIMTTNDMPIVEPPTLDALRLVAFQINPHYVDPAVGSTHMARAARPASASTTRRTTTPWSACARARCCASRARPSSCAARRSPHLPARTGAGRGDTVAEIQTLVE